MDNPAHVGPLPDVRTHPAPAGEASRRTEPAAIRAADLVIASVALVVFLPLLIVLAIAVYCSNPGPIFFSHERLGYRGRLFKCYKFRSMVVDAESRLAHLLATDGAARAEWERDHKLVNDPRITPFGRFLRKSSLDELPQLWNVLCGEMSIVGPRPIVEKEVARYGRYIADYYRVKPGLTGLWQISGRSTTTYRRRVALDVAYSRSANFRLYCRIVAYTIPAVLLARGSY